MRRFLLTVTVMVIGTLLLGSGQVLADRGHQDGRDRFPDVISLPNGFRPEGISTGRGTSFYVGSLGDGSIYRGDLRTGEGEILVPGDPGVRAATGNKVDQRNRLWVAGGANGTGRVYDAGSGELLAEYQFTKEPSFINDVVVTKDAAYFTNSSQNQLFVVPLGRGGRLPAAATVLGLTGAIQPVPAGQLSANGIEASPDGRTLLIVQTSTGFLFKVDPKSGSTSRVDLGGYLLTNGDGLLRRGSTLYAVQNRLNKIAVISLGRNDDTGKVVRTIENSNFDVPTTVAAFGGSLYAVNARFTTPPTADTTYTVVKVPAAR